MLLIRVNVSSVHTGRFFTFYQHKSKNNIEQFKFIYLKMRQNTYK